MGAADGHRDATSRIRLGPLVTPVARRRPGTLARQTTSVDRLSGGRLVFGAGLGFTVAAEFGTWGEPTDPRVLATRLDEGLAVLSGLWSGESVSFQGTEVTATDVTFLPTLVQRPRPPVWIGCDWPDRRRPGRLDRSGRSGLVAGGSTAGPRPAGVDHAQDRSRPAPLPGEAGRDTGPLSETARFTVPLPLDSLLSVTGES